MEASFSVMKLFSKMFHRQKVKLGHRAALGKVSIAVRSERIVVVRSFVNPKASLLRRSLPSFRHRPSTGGSILSYPRALLVGGGAGGKVVQGDGSEVPPCYAAPPPTPSWPTGCLLFGLPGYRSQWRKNPQPRATRPESQREIEGKSERERERDRHAVGFGRGRLATDFSVDTARFRHRLLTLGLGRHSGKLTSTE